MKLLFTFCFIIVIITNSTGQVGINTQNPMATMDVVGDPLSKDRMDGIIPTRLTGNELNYKTYTTAQTGAMVYITSPRTEPDNGQTANVLSTGFYYFTGSIWEVVGKNSSNEIGDIKTGVQVTDHHGWVKLDGRLLSTLTTTQQLSATTLEFDNNLPDATDTYLSQNGQTPGSVSGTSIVMIAQNQLPDVNLTTSMDGSHKHSIMTASNDTNGPESQGYPSNNNHYAFRTTDRNQRTETGNDSQLILNGGDHSHTTSSINGGVTQQGLDITPRTMSVNMFIFLGE